ncbi:hypothetical protein B0T22DRAFT_367695 [Podospora appendiculata]|uniref:F-box domain-containing protein n=1 Tax=Podospora appendiculata TaxID=314037 RepID=A0AAE0XH14_9PEZI|nr:hypothetical protein B0T22DRAFT_367695 [Podospora appendiculata]
MATLQTLPFEILCLTIIPLLSPIALIALSQTSRAFREFINPTRHDFLNRLLALELLPATGGIVPLFRPIDNLVAPPFSDPAWRTTRYACAGCLKLRPHMLFDNHAILRTGLRKPPPGSREAERMRFTDWEVDAATATRKRVQRLARTAKGLKCPPAWRRDLSPNGISPPGAFVPGDDGAPGYFAQPPAPDTCGITRHKRLCNECRYLRGDWARPGSNYGSAEVPIVKSRRPLPYRDLRERYIPGLFRAPPLMKQPRLFRVWNWARTEVLSGLDTVRCPGCEAWQELGAFRFKVPLRLWSPEMLRTLRCNHCVARESGRDDLEMLLTGAVLELMQTLVREVAERLVFGWRFIKKDFDSGGQLEKYTDAREKILGGLEWEGTVIGGDTSADLKTLDMKDLSLRHEHLRQFLENDVPADVRGEVIQSWVQIWFEDYGLNEICYRVMQIDIIRVQLDPQFVVDYMLDRNPYRLY